jgi:hypothetical protein
MTFAYSYMFPPCNLVDSSVHQLLPCTLDIYQDDTQAELLTLASKRIKRSFLFLSKTPILTLKNPASLPLSFLGKAFPLPLASGLARPNPGAPNTLGSRKGDEAGIVGVGDAGRAADFVRECERYDADLGVRGGEDDHDGFMFSGSIL